MQDIKINKETAINPIARERYLKGDSENGVLIIHGYTGHSGDMEYLGQKIHQSTDYSVYIPRLPGHGTNARDFRETGARDWLRATYDNYLKMKKNNENVYIVGLSMGGLLTLLTSARFPVKRVALISAALYVKNKLMPFSHILKHIKPILEKDLKSVPNSPEEPQTENEIYHQQQYYTKTYTAQVAELHKLMLLTRKRLPKVNSPTLILASEKDETVPVRAAYKIESEISSPSRLHIFKNSPHVINLGPEKDECARQIIKFFNGGAP